MQVKLGMPEILIIFSLIMYSQSFTFSVIAFCLGLVSRSCVSLLEHGVEAKKAEALNNTAEELGQQFKDIFGAKKD